MHFSDKRGKLHAKRSNIHVTGSLGVTFGATKFKNTCPGIIWFITPVSTIIAFQCYHV